MAGLAAERVLQKLSGVKAISKHPEDLAAWVAHCPSHHDQHQSLHISERTDESVGLHCHAGCDKFTLLNDLGLEFADLFAPKSTKKQILATYDYYGLDGVLLYQAVRFWPKEFSQRRLDATGHWVWDMKPFKGKLVPYKLPKLKGQNLVVVVEGEKDADKLWQLGIAATTNIGGAKKWGSSETKALKAAGVARVIILPDNDPPGKAHALIVGQSVKSAGIAASVLELPHLPEHGDVSDWLNNGGTKDELLTLMQKMYVLPPGAPPVPAPAPTSFLTLPDALPDPVKYTITATVGAGAAEAFRDRYADRLRYDHARDKWFIWDQHRWRMDVDEEVMRLALQHSRQWGHEVIAASSDYIERKRWSDYTLKLERRQDRVTMLADARSLPPFAGSHKWDADPWLLGVPNGVLDLRTGILRDGHPSDYITLQTGVAYDPHATCPRWQQFLTEIFGTDNADMDVIAFIQQFCGYLLTGRTSEQIVVFCYGKGRNGKGRLMHAIRGVLGEYSAVLPFTSLVARKGADQASNDLASIQGKRLVTASEINEGTRLNEARIKALTGEDPITARFLYAEYGTFEPVAKFVLSVNHKPIVKDDSIGFWRRVRLVPFIRSFEGEQQDKGLDAKLTAEWPGILAWAVQGCMDWQHAGQLPEPATVMQETKEYQEESDPLGDFLGTCCVQYAEATTGANLLFKAYLHWCEDTKRSKEDRLTSTAFGLAVSMKFKKKREASGVTYYGIGVTKDIEDALGKEDGHLFGM